MQARAYCLEGSYASGGLVASCYRNRDKLHLSSYIWRLYLYLINRQHFIFHLGYQCTGENAPVRLRLLRNTKLLSFGVAVLIFYLHKSHNKPLLPPKICIIIICNFSWDMKMSQEKSKTMPMHRKYSCFLAISISRERENKQRLQT